MAGTSGQHLLGEGGGGGGLGPRVNIWGFGSTRCSHVSPHIRVTFPLNSSPSLFMSSYKSKYVHLEISRPQQKQHLCFSRPRGSWYLACEKDPFLKSCKQCSLKKITRPKLLLFQPGGSGRIERGGQCGLWSVSAASHHKAFYPPVTLHSCNHQLPSTKHCQELSGAIKPIWSTDFRMSSRALLMIGVVADFPDSAVGHAPVSVGP